LHLSFKEVEAMRGKNKKKRKKKKKKKKEKTNTGLPYGKTRYCILKEGALYRTV
jgi:hypothetical protein